MYFSVYTSHDNFLNPVCFWDITFSIPVAAKHNLEDLVSFLDEEHKRILRQAVGLAIP